MSINESDVAVGAAARIVLVVSGSIWKLETQDVILVESVPLQGIYDQSGLELVVKVSEAEYDFLTGPFLSGDETYGLVAREGPEDVRDLSLGGI